MIDRFTFQIENDYALIPLYNRKGFFKWAKCDLEDADRISKYKWHVNNAGYAKSSRHELMHREILCYKGKLDVDHINQDRLDNRRENLRVVSRSANAQNCKSGGKSKYLGVSLKKSSGKWHTQISFNWKKIHGGYFLTEQEAARRYNELALKLHGPNARLNEV